MSSPIKFDPNDRLNAGGVSKEKKRAEGIAGQFHEVLEDEKKSPVARLKKHNKSLDAESEDLEEFGHIPEKKSSTIFDLSSGNQQMQKQRSPESLFKEEAAVRAPLDEEDERHAPTHEMVLDKPKKQEPTLPEELVPDLSAAASRLPKITTPVEKKEEDDIPLTSIPPPLPQETIRMSFTDIKVEAVPRPIHEIAAQVIEKLSQLKIEGRTETIITLKHPPLLAGATIILTSFDSATGEFNIAFENLSPQAKAFLDTRLDSLKITLESAGYTTHILSASTTVERPPIDWGNPERERQRNRQQEQPDEEKEE